MPYINWVMIVWLEKVWGQSFQQSWETFPESRWKMLHHLPNEATQSQGRLDPAKIAMV